MAQPSPPTKVAFIGAGAVNFGGHGNAWDHASRLEAMAGDVIFVGIADVFIQQAEKVLEIRRKGPHSALWKDTKTFADYRDMLKQVKPDCVFIGLPPNVHGDDNRAVEVDCIEAKVHSFIEKPISASPPESMKQFTEKIVKAEEAGLVVSVAYMFRYSKAIQKMKELAKSFGDIKLVQARYNCAYTKIGKLGWWDTEQSGGPVVEQATHFVDLSRYFCGDAELSSVQAMSIKASDPIGALAHMSVDESAIPTERRIPRVTTASWKFKNGAMGLLTHTVLLHGWNYESQIEIYGDGFYIALRDPYGKCLISYRAPGTEEEKTFEAPDDPYRTEIQAFVHAIRDNDHSKVQSTYADAFKSYELTWAIRRSAESNKY